MLYGVWGEAYGSDTMSNNTSKAQQARMNNEAAVSALAKRLRKGTKAAVKELQDILINASGHDIKHETLTRIQGAFITGDAKKMADGIEETYTGKQPRNNVPRGESSNLAWLMHIVDGKENPWTPSTRGNRAISKDAFKAMKVRNGGHIPDGLSVKEAIAQGFLSTDGRAIKGDPAPATEPMADAAPVAFNDMTPEQREAQFQAFLRTQV